MIMEGLICVKSVVLLYTSQGQNTLWDMFGCNSNYWCVLHNQRFHNINWDYWLQSEKVLLFFYKRKKEALESFAGCCHRREKKLYRKTTNFPLFHRFEIQTGKAVKLPPPPPLTAHQQGAVHVRASFSPAPGSLLKALHSCAKFSV